MNISVIIPALNEAENLPRLIHDVFQAQDPDDTLQIIVVDNGSTDETSVVARQAGALVVAEPRRGYGFACAAGVRAAETADTLVFLDGDHSFDPAEMPALLAPIRQGEADLVLGSRLQGNTEIILLPHQQFGNWLTARLMRRLYGLHVTDLGPYRAIRSDLLTELHMQEMTFGWPTEMMVKAARRGARIIEIPVSYRNRRVGKSKVSGTLRGSVLASYYILRTTFRYTKYAS